MPAFRAHNDIHPVVPPFLLERIAEHSPSDRRGITVAHASSSAARTLVRDRELVERRRNAPAPEAPVERRSTASAAQGPERSIHDANHEPVLPGVPARGEGDDPTGDESVDEAYDGLGVTFRFFREAYGRNSLDGRGLPLKATVHYDRDYDNAFWDGERMVFGDGDGEVFGRFTASLSVIAHELSHGFTQYTSQLEYSGQAGALNESVSDVFGVLVEQYSLGHSAEKASWLVGRGLFLPAVQGNALRSMIEPGTAYDDDVLGKDPQPADMDGYVETLADNGGVHINSGIPNRAFALTALELGGPAWERAGQVWFDVCTARTLSATADFSAFAGATIEAAAARFGVDSDVGRALTRAWDTVGVKPDESDFGGSATRRT